MLDQGDVSLGKLSNITRRPLVYHICDATSASQPEMVNAFTFSATVFVTRLYSSRAELRFFFLPTTDKSNLFIHIIETREL